MPRIGDFIGYARVSTTDQDLVAQRDRLFEEGAVRIFEDVISGKTFDHPACPHFSTTLGHETHLLSFDLIDLDDCSKNCWKLETVEDIKSREINLIRLEERIDTTSAAGELVFHIFGTIAQFERRLISQRTKDGLATARKHGRMQRETISARSTYRNLLREAGNADMRHGYENGFLCDVGFTSPTLQRNSCIVWC